MNYSHEIIFFKRIAYYPIAIIIRHIKIRCTGPTHYIHFKVPPPDGVSCINFLSFIFYDKMDFRVFYFDVTTYWQEKLTLSAMSSAPFKSFSVYPSFLVFNLKPSTDVDWLVFSTGVSSCLSTTFFSLLIGNCDTLQATFDEPQPIPNHIDNRSFFTFLELFRIYSTNINS